MINNVTLTGRLTADPELKHAASGTAIATFRLAVDRGRKGDDGETQADFIKIVAFQKTAELAAQYLDKGSLVGIEGRIQSRTWEDNDGKRRYEVEVIADRVVFLESRKDAEARRGGAAPASAGRLPDGTEDPFGDQ